MLGYNYINENSDSFQAIAAILSFFVAVINLAIIFHYARKSHAESLRSSLFDEIIICLGLVNKDITVFKDKALNESIVLRDSKGANGMASAHCDQYKLMEAEMISIRDELMRISRLLGTGGIKQTGIITYSSKLKEIRLTISNFDGLSNHLINYINCADAVTQQVDASILLHGYQPTLDEVKKIQTLLGMKVS